MRQNLRPTPGPLRLGTRPTLPRTGPAADRSTQSYMTASCICCVDTLLSTTYSQAFSCAPTSRAIIIGARWVIRTPECVMASARPDEVSGAPSLPTGTRASGMSGARSPGFRQSRQSQASGGGVPKRTNKAPAIIIR